MCSSDLITITTSLNTIHSQIHTFQYRTTLQSTLFPLGIIPLTHFIPHIRATTTIQTDTLNTLHNYTHFLQTQQLHTTLHQYYSLRNSYTTNSHTSLQPQNSNTTQTTTQNNSYHKTQPEHIYNPYKLITSHINKLLALLLEWSVVETTVMRTE